MNNVSWSDRKRNGFELVVGTLLANNLSVEHAESLARRLGSIHRDFRNSIDRVTENLCKTWTAKLYPKTVVSEHPQDLTSDLCRRICKFWRIFQGPNPIYDLYESTPWVVKGYKKNTVYYPERPYLSYIADFQQKRKLEGLRCRFDTPDQNAKAGPIEWWLLPKHLAKSEDVCIVDRQSIIYHELNHGQTHRGLCYGICLQSQLLHRYDARSKATDFTLISSHPLPKECLFTSPVVRFSKNVGYIFQKQSPYLYLFEWDPSGSVKEKVICVNTESTPNAFIMDIWTLPSGDLLIEAFKGVMICLSPQDVLSGIETQFKWKRETNWSDRPLGASAQYSKIDVLGCSNEDILTLGFVKCVAGLPNQDIALVDGKTGVVKSSKRAQVKLRPAHWAEHPNAMDAQLVDEHRLALLYPDGLVIVQTWKNELLYSHLNTPSCRFIRLSIFEVGMVAVLFESKENPNSNLQSIGMQLFRVDNKQIVCLQSIYVGTRNESLRPQDVELEFKNFAFKITFANSMGEKSIATLDFSRLWENASLKRKRDNSQN